MNPTIEYVADLFASTAILIAAGVSHSLLLAVIGTSAFVLTVGAKNLAAWVEHKRLNEHR
jgi:hypothetical protein